MAAPEFESRPDARDADLHSFADVLTTQGFADAAALRNLVSAWMHLLLESQATHVVLDYAHAAQLATLLAAIPAACITNGFDAPPPDCPVFGVSMRGPMLRWRNERRLAQVNAAIAGVANSAACRNDIDLRTLLSYPTRWYDCIPATDPYGPRIDGIYLGPVGRPPQLVSGVWPPGPTAAPRILVYLRSGSQLAQALDSMPDDALVIGVSPGSDARLLKRLQRKGTHLYKDPIALDDLLAQCDAVVNYGSAGFVCQTLLAGKPQLMWPTDIEKHLVSARVARMGAGHLLRSGSTRADVRRGIHAALRHGSLIQAAQNAAVACHVPGGGLAKACTAWLASNMDTAQTQPEPESVH